ncbi:MAG: S8 family serine peptidase, partial [Mycobacterium sp.]
MRVRRVFLHGRLRLAAALAASVAVMLAAVSLAAPASGASAERPRARFVLASVVTGSRTVDFLADAWKPDKDLGSFYMVNKSIGSQDVWGRSDSRGAKYTGAGIGVALIDSGVVAVEGLRTPGKVINGPDLSFESQDPQLRYLDTFGHGTHMAGIIAGRDSVVKSGNENDSNNFVGVAPGAHIVSVKVAASDGATDVSQVIAGIDWVVAHRNDPGLNIRVLNLSFGTASVQSYQVDPLAFAVEQAWRSGIIVVVAAGNDGAAGTILNNPAIDPYVIAVGAADHAGTEKRDDDRLADFSSVGSPTRAPDLVAPGRSLVSLRAPGSWLDEQYASARVAYGKGEPRFFRGSGTSQAAAVVSGAVALLLDERPALTPDQVKYVLKANADVIAGSRTAQGAGLIDLKDIQKVD